MQYKLEQSELVKRYLLILWDYKTIYVQAFDSLQEAVAWIANEQLAGYAGVLIRNSYPDPEITHYIESENGWYETGDDAWAIIRRIASNEASDGVLKITIDGQSIVHYESED